MRGLCYRTIAKVRQRQQQEQQQPLQPQHQQPQRSLQGVQSPPGSGFASPAGGYASPALSDDGAAGPVGGGGRRHRGRGGVLPFGGFIGHLLGAENPLIGRQFTDLEVGLHTDPKHQIL